MKNEYICIGEIVKPQGNKGELKILPLTDFPGRFLNIDSVYIGSDEGELVHYQVEKIRSQKNFFIVKLIGINDIDGAEEFRNLYLYIPYEELPELPEGEYFIFEIIGLEVYEESGRYWGKIVRVLTGSDNDIYVIERKPGDGSSQPEEVMIPAAREIIRDIDLEGGTMTIKPIPGLEGINNED